MSDTDLVQFDELKANITLYVAPTLAIEVTDPASGEKAIEAGKLIKGYQILLEKKRKELVAPLNEQVKRINAYVKSIEEPLAVAESHIKFELATFEQEQEKIRQAKLREEEARRAREAEAARVEQERQAAELAAKHRAELARIEAEKEAEGDDDIAALFGSDEEAQAKEEYARAQAEAKAKAEREAAIREGEAKQRQWDIDNAKVKNSMKVWKCEATDISLVPREFLVISLNTQAVVAAAKGGVLHIPGVRLWQETNVRLGAKTSMGTLIQRGR